MRSVCQPREGQSPEVVDLPVRCVRRLGAVVLLVHRGCRAQGSQVLLCQQPTVHLRQLLLAVQGVCGRARNVCQPQGTRSPEAVDILLRCFRRLEAVELLVRCFQNLKSGVRSCRAQVPRGFCKWGFRQLLRDCVVPSGLGPRRTHSHGGRKCRAVVFRHFSQFSVTIRKIGHHLGRVVVSESLVRADRLSSSRAFKRIYERYTSEHTISKCIFRRGNSASFRYSRAGMSNVVLLQGAMFAVSVCVTFPIFGSRFIVLRHFWLYIFSHHAHTAIAFSLPSSALLQCPWPRCSSCCPLSSVVWSLSVSN